MASGDGAVEEVHRGLEEEEEEEEEEDGAAREGVTARARISRAHF